MTPHTKKKAPAKGAGKKGVPARKPRRAQAPKAGSQYEWPTRNTEREAFPIETSPADKWESFQKRPVTIQAMRFDAMEKPEPQSICRCDDVPLGGQPHIHTLEGHHIVSDGDWVIRGVHGEFYPCKPDIFKKTYKHVPRIRPKSPSHPPKSKRGAK